MNASDNRFYREPAAMSERDQALAIHHEITSPESVEAALELWQDAPAGLSARSVMSMVLARTSAAAMEAVLARRQSQAARTGPWDAPCEERERCARAIEDMAIALRDHGPKTAEGLLTALAGAQVGALLDAAAALRGEAGPWEGGHHSQEEDGYPGSLLPRPAIAEAERAAGIRQSIEEMTRHARLDSTGDETKAAFHIAVNWLSRR